MAMIGWLKSSRLLDQLYVRGLGLSMFFGGMPSLGSPETVRRCAII